MLREGSAFGRRRAWWLAHPATARCIPWPTAPHETQGRSRAARVPAPGGTPCARPRDGKHGGAWARPGRTHRDADRDAGLGLSGDPAHTNMDARARSSGRGTGCWCGGCLRCVCEREGRCVGEAGAQVCGGAVRVAPPYCAGSRRVGHWQGGRAAVRQRCDSGAPYVVHLKATPSIVLPSALMSACTCAMSPNMTPKPSTMVVHRPCSQCPATHHKGWCTWET